HCLLSGRVSQIAILYCPSFEGTSYMPVFSDFVNMVDKIAGLAIASPRMEQMATGQKTDVEELGVAKMHAKKSGSYHFVANTEEEAAEIAKKLLSYLPDNFEVKPPVYDAIDPSRNP